MAANEKSVFTTYFGYKSSWTFDFFVSTARFIKMTHTHSRLHVNPLEARPLASSWPPMLLPNLLLLQEESRSPIVTGLVPLPFVKFFVTRRTLSSSSGSCLSVYFWYPNSALLQEESRSPIVTGLVPLPFVKFVVTRRTLSSSSGSCLSVYFWHPNSARIRATNLCIKRKNF